MQFTCNKIQVQDEDPTDLIRKTPAEQWYVRDAPLLNDAKWVVFRKGDRVVIPLFPYLLADDPTDLAGFMFQLGLLATQSVPGVITRVHVSLGYPMSQVQSETGTTAWRVWLGVAVTLRS